MRLDSLEDWSPPKSNPSSTLRLTGALAAQRAPVSVHVRVRTDVGEELPPGARAVRSPRHLLFTILHEHCRASASRKFKHSKLNFFVVGNGAIRENPAATRTGVCHERLQIEQFLLQPARRSARVESLVQPIVQMKECLPGGTRTQADCSMGHLAACAEITGIKSPILYRARWRTQTRICQAYHSKPKTS